MSADRPTPLPPSPSPLFIELERILSRWLLWFRFRRALHWAQTGAVIGLGTAFGLAVLLVLRGDWVRQDYVWALMAGVGAGILIAGLVGALWPIGRIQAAQFFDQRFGLRERVSTALEVSASQPTHFASSQVFTRRQLEDTLTVARRVQTRRLLPVRLFKVQSALLVVILAGATIFYTRGGPAFNLAAQRRSIRQAIQQQTAQIEALQSQIEQNPELTPEQRQALTQPLEEAIQKLQEAQSAESAASALNEAAQKLQALEEPQTGQMAQALKDAGKGLAQQEGSPLQGAGQNLAQGDASQAAQDLGNLDPGTLTPQQSQALAQQLEGLAESVQASNPGLAAQLNQAAQALKNGDPQAAKQALKDAAQALAQAGQQIAAAQAAGQAADQVSQGQQQVMQAGSGGQGQQGQGQAAQGQGNQGQGSGQGQGGNGQGAGQGQGQGSSSQTGQGGSGGAGRGEGGGDTQTGGEAGSNPIQQGNGPGDAGERAYDPVYAPTHLGGNDQNPVILPGQNQPGSQVTGQGNTALGDPSASTVPYTQALPAYSEAYRQAIESGQVPTALRSLVKQYFISLQP